MAGFVRKFFVRYSPSLLNNLEQNNVKTKIVRFKSVKAAVLHDFKEELVIEKIDTPKKLKDNEVRIKTQWCGLNVSDILIARGEYDVTPKLPYVPGHEIAGKITELGGKVSKEFSVGSRVLALTKGDFGGLAEEVVVSQSDLWTVPSTIPLKTAAALADNYSTALLGLGRRAKIKENDVLLIGAGSGGLGLAAMDFAANVYKAKVIVVCSTEERASALRDKGVWAALTYFDKGICKKIADITQGKGVGIVFDAIGGPMFETALKCVTSEGTVIVAGHAIRQVPHVKIAELLPRSFSLMGVSLRNYLLTNPEAYRQAVQDALDMCEQELVNPLVTQTYKLEDANKAFKHLEDLNCLGKILVEMED